MLFTGIDKLVTNGGMQTVTPAELQKFMDERDLTVLDIYADTKIHTNTSYRFLKGESVNKSTVETLSRWKHDRETGGSPKRAALG
jgi:predicted transcriptional regulator